MGYCELGLGGWVGGTCTCRRPSPMRLHSIIKS